MPTIPAATHILTRAEAHWILTGYGLTDAEADTYIDNLIAYGEPLTSKTLRP